MVARVDPRTLITTPGGRRSLEALVARDREAAVAALVALVEGDLAPAKFFLAWAGRVALGAHPLRAGDARPDAIAALEGHHPRILARLGDRDRQVACAATLALAACRAPAAELQRVLASTPPAHPTIAYAMRLASGVLARDTGQPSGFEPMAPLAGEPLYYADVVRRALVDEARAGELELVLNYSNSLSKLPWFHHGYAPIVRALLRTRPAAEREAAALALVAEGCPDRAIALVFEHREVGRHTGAFTVAQRAVLAAPIDRTRHASQIAILCDDHGIPRTDPERAAALAEG